MKHYEYLAEQYIQENEIDETQSPTAWIEWEYETLYSILGGDFFE